MPLSGNPIVTRLPMGGAGNACASVSGKLRGGEKLTVDLSSALGRVESVYVDCTQNSVGIEIDFPDTGRSLVVPPGSEICTYTFSSATSLTISNLDPVNAYIFKLIAFSCHQPVFERFPGAGILRPGGVAQPSGQPSQTTPYVNPGPPPNLYPAAFDPQSQASEYQNDIQFSNNFTTVSIANSAQGQLLSRCYGVNALATGKYYMEFHYPNNIQAGGAARISLMSSVFAGLGPSPVAGAASSDPVNGDVEIGADGSVYYGGVVVFTGDNYYNGNAVVQVAVDLSEQMIWYAVNGGNWNGKPDNDPSLGLGFQFGRLRAPFLYGIVRTPGETPAVFSINNGQQNFSFPVPAGFNKGWPSGQ